MRHRGAIKPCQGHYEHLWKRWGRQDGIRALGNCELAKLTAAREIDPTLESIRAWCPRCASELVQDCMAAYKPRFVCPRCMKRKYKFYWRRRTS